MTSALPRKSVSVRFIVLNAIMLLAACFALPRMASAHAVLRASTPTENATIDQAKVKEAFPVLLTFNSRIDAAHSSLSLLAHDGKSIPVVVDTSAPANVLSGHASGIQAGHYSLRWQVLAADGHITRGAISFDVR